MATREDPPLLILMANEVHGGTNSPVDNLDFVVLYRQGLELGMDTGEWGSAQLPETGINDLTYCSKLADDLSHFEPVVAFVTSGYLHMDHVVAFELGCDQGIGDHGEVLFSRKGLNCHTSQSWQ